MGKGESGYGCGGCQNICPLWTVVVTATEAIFIPLAVVTEVGFTVQVVAFAGTLHAQEAALAHGVKISGCTVHLVTTEVDSGPIVLQATVPVHEDDTVDSLSVRILEQEHRLLPQAVRPMAEWRVKVVGRRTVTTGPGH